MWEIKFIIDKNHKKVGFNISLYSPQTCYTIKYHIIANKYKTNTLKIDKSDKYIFDRDIRFIRTIQSLVKLKIYCDLTEIIKGYYNSVKLYRI